MFHKQTAMIVFDNSILEILDIYPRQLFYTRNPGPCVHHMHNISCYSNFVLYIYIPIVAIKHFTNKPRRCSMRSWAFHKAGTPFGVYREMLGLPYRPPGQSRRRVSSCQRVGYPPLVLRSHRGTRLGWCDGSLCFTRGRWFRARFLSPGARRSGAP